MTLSAHDVAAALRERLPGVPTKKLHKLLYYCQGHHLAAFGEPLFGEAICAYDMGPVVVTLWKDEQRGDVPPELARLNEAELNTVGYVISRYGGMTGRELEILTHGEAPWRRADANRLPGTSARIEPEWIREYFLAAEIADREDDPVFNSEEVRAMLAGAEERRRTPGRRDDIEELRARLDALAPGRA